MELIRQCRFKLDEHLPIPAGDNPYLWRCFQFRFVDLPDSTDNDEFAERIFNIFESLPGQFYYHYLDGITVFCKMAETVIIDDVIYKIKNLIKGDYTCRVGEQKIVLNGVISLQFLFSPSEYEQQRLSQEFITEEKKKRASDVIMVVEDDLFARKIMVNALKTKFKVIEVTDGAKATQEYVAHTPDVLFLDIHLPNKKGTKIMEEILEIDPQAYIVMVSADAARERVISCMDLGAKGFIAKPFRGEKLFDYIRKCPTIRVYC